MTPSRLTILAVAAVTACQMQGQVELLPAAQPPAKIYVEIHKKPAPLPGRQQETADRWHAEALAIAVEDLNYHIEKMSGTRLEVVQTDDPAAIVAPAIVLGKPAVALGALPPPSPSGLDGFRILTSEGRVLIGGEHGAATMFGVYELLRTLGCDWIMPGEIGEIIPTNPTIAIPPIELATVPDFTIRAPWYSGGTRIVDADEAARFNQWKHRHKLIIRTYQHLHDPYVLVGGHFWDALIRTYKSEFEADPEMLALVRLPDGTLDRRGPQIETTNPRAIALAIRYIRETFERHGWPQDTHVNISLGPADGMGYSVSPESIAAGTNRMDPTLGSPDTTDLLVLFCNTILEEIGDEFPNLRVGFYLYSVHQEYPMRYKPHPRVAIVIADINFSRYHSILDANSKSRVYYEGILQHWRELCKAQGNIVYFRGYNWNLAENLLPYTKLKIWGEDIPYYKAMGSRGATTQWFKGWGNTGPSDYLEARMLWDANLDWREVLTEYCLKAFGAAAAPAMEQYYHLLVDTQHGAGEEAGSYHAAHLIFNEDFLTQADTLFQAALAAAETPAQKTRIEGAHTPLTSLMLYLDYRAAFTSFNFASASDRLSRLHSHLEEWAVRHSDFIDRQAAGYLRRFHQRFIDQAVTYSSGEYAIIHRLPDRLKTMFDPFVMGQEMGFQNPEINDRNFIETATWSMPWESQGLGGYRDGAVWYRIPFTIPAEHAETPIGLFIGGVDELVRVWCNGTYIGNARGFSLPFQFDLTDALKRDGENLLAIQVQRYSKATELGTGGIIYPAFIFAGPQLASKAPLQTPLRRVLPGGAEGELEP